MNVKRKIGPIFEYLSMNGGSAYLMLLRLDKFLPYKYLKYMYMTE